MLLPIIMLHQVKNPNSNYSNGWSISCDKFLELINYLKDSNYDTITFADIVANNSLLVNSSKKVILTFDDGYKHLFDFAIPELLKRKMKAVFYIPTAYLGAHNSWETGNIHEELEIMDEADLRELDKLGMEIGAHSHNHIKLKNVNDAHRIERELLMCKNTIETIIKRPVYSFAYPFASIPKDYKKHLSKAGYSFALSIYQPFENKFALRRFGYYSKDTTSSLRFKLSRSYKILRAIYDPFKKY